MKEPGKQSRKRKWVRTAGEVLVFLALLVGLRAWQQRGIAEGPAPRLEGVGLDGRALSLAQLAGRPVLIHFWASWCSVCRSEQGSVQAIASQPSWQVITVATDSGSAAKVAEYMKSQGLDFPTIVDSDGRLARAYGVRGLPSTFVVGPDGSIKFAEVGFTTRLGMLARLWLAGR